MLAVDRVHHANIVLEVREMQNMEILQVVAPLFHFGIRSNYQSNKQKSDKKKNQKLYKREP